MIVTGDRDVFQLIDEQGLVKVMATARGITETKIYDRQAVIDRYGIAPELIPDFYGLKGDTSDNIPGIPGIGDKTASELIQSYGSLEEVLVAHRRHQRRQAQTEPARARRGRARVQAPGDGAARRGGRPRHRRRGGARARPLARCARCSATTSCATRCGAWRRRSATPSSRRRRRAAEVRLTARVRAGTPADIARLGAADAELCVAVRASEAPEGALFAEGAPWRFAVAARRGGRGAGGRVRGARAGRRRRAASAPVVAHDAKALGLVPPALAHDTLLGAYLLEPATARLSLRGAVRRARAGRRRRRSACRRRGAARCAGRLAARADRRAGPGRRDARDRAAARGVLREMELSGVRLELRAPGRGHRARARGDRGPGRGHLRCSPKRSS